MSRKKKQGSEELKPLPPLPEALGGTPTLDPKFANSIGAQSVAKDAFDIGTRDPRPPDELSPFERSALSREKRILEQALREELREGSRDFWYFLTVVLFPEIWQKHYTEAFHKPICDKVTGLPAGEDLWVFLPRESRKSFILNIARSIWRIVNDPDIRLLLVGAREETVKPFARLILSAFMPGTPGFEHFQWVYPDFVIHNRGRTLLQSFQFTHPLRKKTYPDPTFRATYLGVTGAGWRCDEMDFDDCVERRNCLTPEMAVKTTTQIMDLFPLVDTGSRYRHIFGQGTRWSFFDPYGRIIGDAPKDLQGEQEVRERVHTRKIHVVVRHAFESPEPCQHCPPRVTNEWPHGHPALKESSSVPLSPITTREKLMERMAQYALDPNLGESAFWHQYMNVCVAPGDQKLNPEWLLTYERPGWMAPKRRVLCIDDASKDLQRPGIGDYSVALFGEWSDDGRLLLRHGFRSNRWTKDELFRKILTYCAALNWWPAVVVKEKVVADSFLPDIRREFMAKERTVYVLPVVRSGGAAKNDWIVSSLQGPLERGEVIAGASFPADLLERLKYEAGNLGHTSHDDLIDCLALFFQPGVRVETPSRPYERTSPQWETPPIHLPDPANPNPVFQFDGLPSISPIDDALNRKGVQLVFDTLGTAYTLDNPLPEKKKVGWKFLG